MSAEKITKPEQLEFSREGDLVYIRSSFELIAEMFKKKKLSLKMRDKLFLEMEALIKRYLENFSPASDDKLLLQMQQTQKDIEKNIGRSFFEQMYDSCEMRFRKNNSVEEDKQTLSELVDIIKRYKMSNSLGENDPLLMKMDNLAEEIRMSVQGIRYIERISQQFWQQFLLHKDDQQKCEQILDAAQKEYEKNKSKSGYSEQDLELLSKTVLKLATEYAQIVKKQGYRELHQIVAAVKADNRIESLEKNLKDLEKLAKRVQQFAAQETDIKDQINNLRVKIDQGLNQKSNSEFMHNLSNIQRQLLYAHNEDDYKRLLELLGELKKEMGSRFKTLTDQELSHYKELNKIIEQKHRKVHHDGFKQLFSKIQQSISTAENDQKKELVKKLSFLIREYDSEYQGAKDGDMLFQQMRQYEQKVRNSLKASH